MMQKASSVHTDDAKCIISALPPDYTTPGDYRCYRLFFCLQVANFKMSCYLLQILLPLSDRKLFWGWTAPLRGDVEMWKFDKHCFNLLCFSQWNFVLTCPSTGMSIEQISAVTVTQGRFCAAHFDNRAIQRASHRTLSKGNTIIQWK